MKKIEHVIQIFICRIVSLDLRTNVSAEVEMLCNQDDCSLEEPERMAVVKNKMYIYQNIKKISVFKGESKDFFVTHVTKKSSRQNSFINIYFLSIA